jgi:hypothetical protein
VVERVRLDRDEQGRIMCQLCFDFFEVEDLELVECMVCEGGRARPPMLCSAPCDAEGMIPEDVCKACALAERQAL